MQKIKQYEMDDARGIYFRAIEGDEIEQVLTPFLDMHETTAMFRIKDKIKNVVSKVRAKDPNYTFVIDNWWTADDWRSKIREYKGLPVGWLKVFYKDEQCGEIKTKDDYRGESRMSIAVISRLTKDISRRGIKYSANEDTVVKNVFKYIKPVAIKERMDNLYQRVASSIRQALDNCDTENFRNLRSYHPVAGQVIDNLLEHYPDMVRELLPKSWNSERVERFFDGMESFEGIKKMQQVLEANKGMLVLKYKGDIYLSQPHTHLNSCITRRLKHEQLSDITKQNIAMLTLSTPNTAVTTIGIRVDDDKFYLQDDNGDLYGER